MRCSGALMACAGAGDEADVGLEANPSASFPAGGRL